MSKEGVSSNASFMNGKKPLSIIIIGGSCAGLFAGILLKKQGHHVHILESARSNEREGLAAGVGLAAHVKRFFDENDRLKDIPFGVHNDNMHIMDSNMNIVAKIPISLSMTTWDATYYRLRANFDGYKSSYCLEPPDLSSDAGTATFETGRRVIRVEEGAAGKLSVLTEDAADTPGSTAYEADVVIAADGANSSIRRQLQPNLRREEPGYVLWRGTVPTKDLSKKLLDRIQGRTFMYRMSYSYAIIYTIPGINGSLKDGEREINFAWYTWVSRKEASAMLTDTAGHEHRTTLPKGSMRPEIWQKQLEQARQMIHPDLVELVEKIREPFVTIISTTVSPRAAFFSDRLFLIGDALAQKQPNSAQGVNMAAKNALELADMIAGKMSVRQWEEGVVEDADRERAWSTAFAAWYLDGWFGWAWMTLRHRWIIHSQRWWKWMFGSAYPRLSARL